MEDDMDETRLFKLEVVLALLTEKKLRKNSAYKIGELVDFLYKNNPTHRWSFEECIEHLYRHFPQFTSKEFIKSFCELSTVIKQTNEPEIWDALIKHWLMCQRIKYGKRLKVSCLPRVGQK